MKLFIEVNLRGPEATRKRWLHSGHRFIGIKMVFNEHVKIREEKFGSVIFETLREKVFVTNNTGKDILNLIEKGYSQDKIIETLTNSYDIQAGQIKEEVTNFINQLKDNHIIGF